MEFKKKMKLRFWIAVSYIVLGLTLAATGMLIGFENPFFPAFGFSLALMGILRLFHHQKITKTEKNMRRQELSEKDERTQMIAGQARSWCFSLSVTGSGVLVIVLNILGYQDAALPFAWYVCAMVLLYWICWLIIRKKY